MPEPHPNTERDGAINSTSTNNKLSWESPIIDILAIYQTATGPLPGLETDSLFVVF